MKIKPINDFVIVKLDDPAEKSVSGIIIQKPVNPIQEIAEVVAIFPNAPVVKVGDKIVFKNFHLEEFEHNGEKLGILKYADVIGVLYD